MDYSNRRLITQGLQDNFIRKLSPLVAFFAKKGIRPNFFTVAGVIITSFGAAAFMMEYIRLAGILILLGGLCDTIDGLIARTTGNTTRFGALLDSTVDRYSEFIMFLAIIAYFIFQEDFSTVAICFLALCGSFMVSYTRARAECLGFEAKIGIMQRPERIVLIGLSAIVHITALKVVIWLIAALANMTALQRIRWAFKQDSAISKKGAVLET